jgi:hypothetical protein
MMMMMMMMMIIIINNNTEFILVFIGLCLFKPKSFINSVPKNKDVPVLNSLNMTPWRRVGEWRHSSTILDLGTRWRWVVSSKPLPFYSQGKELPVTH